MVKIDHVEQGRVSTEPGQFDNHYFVLIEALLHGRISIGFTKRS